MESVPVEWTYDKVLQLIALFHQRPVLWDSRCDDYKDRQKRHKATVELSVQFHVEKDEIERKLKNLQSHFYREMRKEQHSKSWSADSTTAHYRSKWFAYQAMKFLINKNKPRRSQTAAGGKTSMRRPKRTVEDAIRVSTTTKISDKNRQCLMGTQACELKFECRTKFSPLRNSPAETMKDKKMVCPANTAASTDFLYVDTNQQNNLNQIDDNQIDYWDEKPINMGNQDPIEFATNVNDEAQQSQRIASFEDVRSNEKPSSSSCKQDSKMVSEDVIVPAIDFLLGEARAHSSNDPELNFYRSLIPDIMKLSHRRRRQFKEVVLCTLNKLLDEDESDRVNGKIRV